MLTPAPRMLMARLRARRIVPWIVALAYLGPVACCAVLVAPVRVFTRRRPTGRMAEETLYQVSILPLKQWRLVDAAAVDTVTHSRSWAGDLQFSMHGRVLQVLGVSFFSGTTQSWLMKVSAMRRVSPAPMAGQRTAWNVRRD